MYNILMHISHSKFYVIALVLLTATGIECAALDSSQNQETAIEALIEQWYGIERRFLQSRLQNGKDAESVFKETGEFRRSLETFLGSETYRIFRLAPFSTDQRTVFAPITFTEIPEIQAAADLALDFCEAVSKGETEKALLVSTDISDGLVRALIRSGEIQQFMHNAYLRLLLVFITFIILMALSIWYLYWVLERSRKREAEGSWFSREILLAQEEERKRISRELHDTVAQDLRWLSMDMDKIANCPDAEKRKKLGTSSAAALLSLMRKVRDICENLVPLDFRHQGLPDALRRLCLDYGKRMGIDCRIDIAEDLNLGGMGEDNQLQIFRIVQEALNNIGKHAQASEVIVILRSEADGTVYVGVSDDGKGFQPPGEKDMRPPGLPRKNAGLHLGLRGMNERAAILGGALKIISDTGEGTLVSLRLPGEKDDGSIVG